MERCHIIPDSLGGEDDPSNIVLLCKRCHIDGPNVKDSEVMWDWIKAYSVPFYNTFWGILGVKEYATAVLNPVSDWVKASATPSGAQVINTKWTYTLREYTSKKVSSLSGWTKYDTKRTDWGSWSSWSTTNPTNGTRNVESRKEYHYYRWTNGSGGVYSYQYSSSYWLEEKWFTYELPVYDGGSQGTVVRVESGGNYKNRWIMANYNGNYSTNKTFTRTTYRYQEPIYTYYYYRDLDKEATSDPTGQSNVSNVVKWVQYRAK